MNQRHRQLTFAREYRGYSQTELASNINGLSQSNLSKFEKGIKKISDDLLIKVMDFLQFPTNFLSKNIFNTAHNVHFRKRATIKKQTRDQFERTYMLAGYLVDQMGLSVDWPMFNLRSYDLEDGYTPNAVAKNVRRRLGLLPNEPIKDIYNLLESNGIIIAEINEDQKFDGVSFVSDEGLPIIVMNTEFSNDRKRFNLAHELGHLLMHCIDDPIIPDYRDCEKEANQFAAEFLMPESEIKNSLFDLKLSSLAILKKRWLTSMSSILRRAKDLGCINQNRYRYLSIEMSRRGLRKNEDIVPVSIDKAVLFKKAYELHTQDLGYSIDELAGAFSLPIDVIDRFFGQKTKMRVLASRNDKNNDIKRIL